MQACYQSDAFSWLEIVIIPSAISLITGLLSGFISGCFVWKQRTNAPIKRRQEKFEEIFRKRFDVFKANIMMAFFPNEHIEIDSLTKEILRKKLTATTSDTITNEVNENEELKAEIVFCANSFFEFLRFFIQAVPDIHPDTWNYLYSLRSESERMLTGRWTRYDNQYFIDFLFDVLTGENYSWHAVDVYECIENLFVPLSKKWDAHPHTYTQDNKKAQGKPI